MFCSHHPEVSQKQLEELFPAYIYFSMLKTMDRSGLSWKCTSQHL